MAGAFPALDTNTLLLLGISQGVYIGSKLTGASRLADVQAIKIELDTKTDGLKTLDEAAQDLNAKRAAGDGPDGRRGRDAGQIECDDRGGDQRDFGPRDLLRRGLEEAWTADLNP